MLRIIKKLKWELRFLESSSESSKSDISIVHQLSCLNKNVGLNLSHSLQNISISEFYEIRIFCQFESVRVKVYLKINLAGLSETRSKNYFCFCLFRFWLEDCFLNLISWTFRNKYRCGQNLFVSSRIFDPYNSVTKRPPRLLFW